jgi:hypothetical protein
MTWGYKNYTLDIPPFRLSTIGQFDRAGICTCMSKVPPEGWGAGRFLQGQKTRASRSADKQAQLAITTRRHRKERELD